ncbi:MAG: HD domain-containing protein [Clostridium sp.]|nr:HD domain-containing protein [Clostridium sp.]
MDIRELCSLLKNADNAEEIDRKREEILALIPAAEIMIDYDQQNWTHQYDLWQHSLHTVLGLPRGLEDDMLYLGALLHDIGKPESQTKGEKDGRINMHYYGHPEKSLQLVKQEIVPTMEWNGEFLSETEKKRLFYYVAFHDDHVSFRKKHLRRHLKTASFEEFQKLMLLQTADAKAHIQVPVIEERAQICEALAGEYGRELYQSIMEERKPQADKRI